MSGTIEHPATVDVGPGDVGDLGGSYLPVHCQIRVQGRALSEPACHSRDCGSSPWAGGATENTPRIFHLDLQKESRQVRSRNRFQTPCVACVGHPGLLGLSPLLPAGRWLHPVGARRNQGPNFSNQPECAVQLCWGSLGWPAEPPVPGRASPRLSPFFLEEGPMSLPAGQPHRPSISPWEKEGRNCCLSNASDATSCLPVSPGSLHPLSSRAGPANIRSPA